VGSPRYIAGKKLRADEFEFVSLRRKAAVALYVLGDKSARAWNPRMLVCAWVRGPVRFAWYSAQEALKNVALNPVVSKLGERTD